MAAEWTGARGQFSQGALYSPAFEGRIKESVFEIWHLHSGIFVNEISRDARYQNNST